MDRIAVLIPCYNESQTITKVVTDFRKTLPEAVIYVYDNNSTDGTDELARKAGAVVRYEYQQGKGNVVRRMFQEVEADCYIMVDGDDTYPAVHAREMADKVLQRNADMLKMATVETAREAQRSIVDIETLQQTNKQLIETLDELNKIRADGKAKRANAEQELGRIEGELRQKMLEING